MIQLILNGFLVPVYERILNDREPDLSLGDPGMRFRNQPGILRTSLSIKEPTLRFGDPDLRSRMIAQTDA